MLELFRLNTSAAFYPAGGGDHVHIKEDTHILMDSSSCNARFDFREWRFVPVPAGSSLQIYRVHVAFHGGSVGLLVAGFSKERTALSELVRRLV